MPRITTPTTTPYLRNGEMTHVEISQFKPLPECFYCPDCGRCHFSNDLSFAADNNGRAWGSAWLDHGYVNTETSDEESSYENMTYSCDHCENDITDRLRDCERWNRLIEQQLQITVRNQNRESVNEYKQLLKNEAQHVSFILDSLEGSAITGDRIYINTVDHDHYFIRVTIQNENIQTYIINPRIAEEAKRIMNDEINSLSFKFNYEDVIYKKINKLYLGLVNQLNLNINSEGPNRARWESGQCLQMYNNAIQGTVTESVATQSATENVVNPVIDTPEQDPMNSMIHYMPHHRRWRENSLDNICECKHCKYLFEADNELDIVVCPKCNKENN